MKVDTAEAVTDDSSVSFAPALRRLGVAVGLVFGFSLLAMFMADEANASEGGSDTADHAIEKTLNDVTAPLTEKAIEPVADTVEPVAKAAEPVTEKVDPVAEAAEPVLTSVAKTAEPVTKPVLSPVAKAAEPVVESAAPVVRPVLKAGEPVVTPVAQAAGVESVVEDSEGAHQESPVDEDATSPSTETESRALEVASPPNPAPASDKAAAIGEGDSSPVPTNPSVPAGDHTAATTSSAGSGGSHHTDSGTLADSSRLRDDAIRERGPPPFTPVVQWYGFDTRSHPS